MDLGYRAVVGLLELKQLLCSAQILAQPASLSPLISILMLLIIYRWCLHAVGIPYSILFLEVEAYREKLQYL